MVAGLSTYAFFWRSSNKVSNPMCIEKMLEETSNLGGKVFQICDYLQIENFDNKKLEQIRQLAESLNLSLELGTKGIEPDLLKKYILICKALNVRIFRTMFNSLTFKPSRSQIESIMHEWLPKFEKDKIKIAIETYEQLKTQDLVSIIKDINHPFLGICLDPANCVASLENPKTVIDMTSDMVINLHIKDFSFSRRDGWVGFNLSGTKLGSGLLDYQYMMEKIKPNTRKINQIVEHWLPWQGTENQTCCIEEEWTKLSIKRLIEDQDKY